MVSSLVQGKVRTVHRMFDFSEFKYERRINAHSIDLNHRVMMPPSIESFYKWSKPALVDDCSGGEASVAESQRASRALCKADGFAC